MGVIRTGQRASERIAFERLPLSARLTGPPGAGADDHQVDPVFGGGDQLGCRKAREEDGQRSSLVGELGDRIVQLLLEHLGPGRHAGRPAFEGAASDLRGHGEDAQGCAVGDRQLDPGAQRLAAGPRAVIGDADHPQPGILGAAAEGPPPMPPSAGFPNPGGAIATGQGGSASR